MTTWNDRETPDLYKKFSKLDSDKVREKFYAALVETGNISAAAKEIGLSRAACYRYRENNETFREEWEEAYETFLDNAEATLASRGINGVREPVYYKGKPCGFITKYSDSNLQRLLAARRKEYRLQQDVTFHGLEGLADRMARANARLEGVRKPQELPPPDPEKYNIIDVEAEDLVDVTPVEAIK